MSAADRIGVMHVRGARVDIADWPLKPEVLGALREAIEVEIDRIKTTTGQHPIVVEVCNARMQITAEEEREEADDDPEFGAFPATRWHGILLTRALRARLVELSRPATRYDRADPV